MQVEFKIGGDIFKSRCTTLVNPVNCVGVMGAGLALQFKNQYPEYYSSYAKHCRAGKLHPGDVYLYTGYEKELDREIAIISFATKDHWRDHSKLDYIKKGLAGLTTLLHMPGVRVSTLAIPALGCGYGGLQWNVVKPLIEASTQLFPSLLDRVEIYEPK